MYIILIYKESFFVLNMIFKIGYCWYVYLFKIICYSYFCFIKIILKEDVDKCL